MTTERRSRAYIDEVLGEHEATRASQPGGRLFWVGTCCVVVDELLELRLDIRRIDLAWRAYCEAKSPRDRDAYGVALAAVIDEAMERA